MSNPSKFPAAAKYVIGFVLGTALLIAVAYLIENWRGDRAWAAEQRRLKEQGLPLSLDELIPPMPPDEENFAMAPIIAPALDITYIDHPDPARRVPIWNQELKWQQLRDLGSPILHAERNGDWRLGRTNDVAQMEQSYRDYLKEIGSGTVTEEGESESLETAFIRIESELDAIEKALQRSHARFPVAYERHFRALLPHLSILYSLSQLYCLRAEIALVNGETASAFQDLITALKISESLKDEPILMSLAMRGTLVDQSIHAIWETLRINPLSEDQLRQLEGQLSRIALLEHLSESLSGERLMLELAIDDFRDSGPWLIGLPEQFPAALVPRGWLQRNKVHVSRMVEVHLRSLVDVAGRRYFPERTTATDQAFEEEVTFLFDKMLTGNLKPTHRIPQKAALVQAQVDLARVAVALERFQLAHGRYPEFLRFLEPHFLETVPRDLMTGEPLSYRRENDRFTLYSAGLNQVDDDGRIVVRMVSEGLFNDKKSFKKMLDLEQGDLVWSYFPLSEATDE